MRCTFNILSAYLQRKKSKLFKRSLIVLQDNDPKLTANWISSEGKSGSFQSGYSSYIDLSFWSSTYSRHK